MNEMKVPSYILRHREQMMKVRELIMNTSLKNEGAIADNEHKRMKILELLYKWLLIVWSESRWQ